MFSKKHQSINTSYGQTVLEYMLLFAVVAAVVLGGWNQYLAGMQNSSGQFFNKVGQGINGPPPPPGKLR